jgi:hypothetical protein
MAPRLAVSVEGPTEREFVTRVLAPHLEPMGIAVKPIPVTWGVSLAKVKVDLRQLVGNQGCTHVSTMYDLYQFQGRDGRDPDEMERELLALVGNSAKFIPYVQTHEFEALTFAGPDEAADVLNNPGVAAGMRRILQQCRAPEQINDGYDTCPSRRLKRLHPAYDKVAHGYRIVERIGLAKVRAACPRFGLWLTRLEGVT